MEPDNISTELIPARYSGWMGRMIGVWMGRWWWLVAMLIGAPLVLGVFVREEWILVALMIALLGYPTLLWWIYVQYGLRPQGRLAMLPRKVDFGPDSFTIIYLAPERSPEDDDEREDDGDGESQSADDNYADWDAPAEDSPAANPDDVMPVAAPLVAVDSVTVRYSDVTSVNIGGRALLIEWGDDPWAYIKVPLTLFSSAESSRQVTERLYAATHP